MSLFLVFSFSPSISCSLSHDSEEDMQAAWDKPVAGEKDQESGKLSEETSSGDKFRQGD